MQKPNITMIFNQKKAIIYFDMPVGCIVRSEATKTPLDFEFKKKPPRFGGGAWAICGCGYFSTRSTYSL